MKIEKTPLRYEISRMYNSGDYNGIGGLEGFVIFEVRNQEKDTRTKFGCVTWIFSGDRAKTREFTSNPESPPGYEEINNPREGDIVTYFIPFRFNRYFADFDPAEPTHFGIYIGNGRVRSKFRESHVYDHPLEAVPLEFGSEVKFFRKVSGTKKIRKSS